MPFLLHSPLEQFEVKSLIGLQIPLLGHINISLTNLGLYTIISVYLVIAFHVIANNNKQLIPSRWSISLESGYASVHSLVKSQIGAANEIYMPFIYSLFFFILFANLNGNVPYGFTVTTSMIVSLGLSVTIFLGVTILGLSIHKLHFFSFFVPSGAPKALIPLLIPIEIISYLARAVSLGVRLFANMVARTQSYDHPSWIYWTNVYKWCNSSCSSYSTIYSIYWNCCSRSSCFIHSSLCILYSNSFISERCN